MSKPLITTNFCASLHSGSLRDFASRIKITPSSVSEKGDIRPFPRPVAPFTEWTLERNKIPSYSVNDEILELLKSLSISFKDLKEVAGAFSAEYFFSSVVYVEDESPIYELGWEAMCKMGELKAGWGIAIQ